MWRYHPHRQFHGDYAQGNKSAAPIYEVGGIAGDYQLFLPPKPEVDWVELAQKLRIEFNELEGKNVGTLGHRATILRLAPNMAEITAEILPPRLSNLRLFLYDRQERLITENLYAKVLKHVSDNPPLFQVNFTAIPPEAGAFLGESRDFAGTK